MSRSSTPRHPSPRPKIRSSPRGESYVTSRGFMSASHIATRSAMSRSKHPPLMAPASVPSSPITARAPARRYVEPCVRMTVTSTPRLPASITEWQAAMTLSISCMVEEWIRTLLLPNHRPRVVPILPPGRMVYVKDVVSVERDHGSVEGDGSDLLPVGDVAAFLEGSAVCGAGVGGLDIEDELAFRRGIAGVVDVGHDFVAEVEVIAGDDRLSRGNGKLHELGGARRLGRWFLELGDLVDLPDGRLFLGLFERNPGQHQNGHAAAAATDGGIRRVAQLGVIDVRGDLAADVFLAHEARGRQRLRMIRIGGGIDAADHRKRPHVAAARFGAARGVAGDDQSAAPFVEVAAIGRVFGDLPSTGHDDGVGVEEALITFPVRPPAKV